MGSRRGDEDSAGIAVSSVYVRNCSKRLLIARIPVLYKQILDQTDLYECSFVLSFW